MVCNTLRTGCLPSDRLVALGLAFSKLALEVGNDLPGIYQQPCRQACDCLWEGMSVASARSYANWHDVPSTFSNRLCGCLGAAERR
jgi:hypothetical protein